MALVAALADTLQTALLTIVSQRTLVHAMEDSPVAHNCGSSPPQRAIMSQTQAQQLLAELIAKLSIGSVCCWWQLLGDEANSLSKFLDIPWINFRLILRKCGIIYGPTDSFKTSEFEKWIDQIGCHCTIYRPKGKPVYFLKLGQKTEDPYAVDKPKEMYSLGGVLQMVPIDGAHKPGTRTKVSRRLAASLVAAATNLDCDKGDGDKATPDDNNNNDNKGSMSTCINDLIDVIKQEILYASRQGEKYVFTQRTDRMLRKAAVNTIKASIRDVFNAWVEQVGDEKEKKELAQIVMSTPSTAVENSTISQNELSTRHLLFREATPNNNQASVEATILITPPFDLTDDVEVVDGSDIDIVLTQIKEQMLLQNLLHKRFVQRERVLSLEHKNGRKLRVIIPPESSTSKAFVEEAKRSKWIQEMLYTEVHQKGMLLYLAQKYPGTYVAVGNQKKLQLQSTVLTTAQTLALGRLTGINNQQMERLRSFLRTVDKAELKFNKKEINRIDADVGLHSTAPAPVFNKCTLEWATTSGKDVKKKLPEQCSHWNANVLIEVAAEIDMVLSTLFLEKPNESPTQMLQSLDYDPPGFDRPGAVVLFGGDHGAGRCPVHLKINFSSPAQRKE